MTAMLRTRVALSLILIVVPLFAATEVVAQDDNWSFFLTPQVWVSHIAKNGFSSPSGNAGTGGIIDNKGSIFFNQYVGEAAVPVDSVNPQWGLQLAAQRDRWTLAGAFQFVNFETRSDVLYKPSHGLSGDVCTTGACTQPGLRLGQEFVHTTRLDVEFSTSYFFPHVGVEWFDLSVGGGFKVIYATASRRFDNLSAYYVALQRLRGGLYPTCGKDDCSDEVFRSHADTTSLFYGATLPMSAVLHLTDDARWLLLMRVSPFIGAENRDDHNVWYQAAQSVYPFNTFFSAFRVKRLDGTTFAYGATVDATIRWLINDSVSTYAGARVQYIEGHNQFLAYGPLVGLSFRFGGK